MPATIPKPPALNTSPVWPPAAPSVPPERAGEIAIWFDGLEDQLVNPAEVEERLRRTGWSPAQAVGVAAQYRRRFNEHSLGYSALLVATGLAALAAGTAGHLLTAGLDGPVDRNALGGWLTLLVCALPFAVWGHWWAAQVDRDDPVAAWSRPRRALGKALLWSAGVVGVGRLLIYAGQLMSHSWARRGCTGLQCSPAR
jgi:hypothetical protein